MELNYKAGYRYKQYLQRVRIFTQEPITKKSLELALTFFMIAFFGLFALKPSFVTIAKLLSEIKYNQETDNKLGKKVNDLYTAQNNYQSIVSDLHYLDFALPAKTDFNRFAAELNILSATHNLIISNFSFGEFGIIPPPYNITTLTFKISVAGFFNDINNFIKDLENLDRLIRINSVVFDNKTEFGGGRIQVDLGGEIYQLVPPEKTTK
jgi:Tfp pilus assembly protein PilO